MAIGVLTAVTRRHAQVYAPAEGMLDALLAGRDLVACVGDRVRWSKSNNDVAVEEILPRDNCLTRSYDGKSKRLAANVDMLFVVTAPAPLFNPSVIDRMLASATQQGISSTLIFNKHDLDAEGLVARDLEPIYRSAGYPVLSTSALLEEGLESVRELLRKPEIKVAALAGVSGVGKSTVLNGLIPGSSVRTSNVSTRTGQGKQTTSQSIGHLFERNEAEPLILVDLPGIQNFGIAHLSEDDVRSAFPEFHNSDDACRFSNCWHLDEPECAVQRQLEKKTLVASRYDSYREMLEEVRTQSRF